MFVDPNTNIATSMMIPGVQTKEEEWSLTCPNRAMSNTQTFIDMTASKHPIVLPLECNSPFASYGRQTSSFGNCRNNSNSKLVSGVPASSTMMPIPFSPFAGEVVTRPSRSTKSGFIDAIDAVLAMFDKDALEPTPIREDCDIIRSPSSGSVAMMIVASSAEESSKSYPPDEFDPLDDARRSEDKKKLDHIISSSDQHPKKKTKNMVKLSPKKATTTSSQYCPKFRVYQKEKWWDRYEDLVHFFNTHGHSQVGLEKDSTDKGLVRWVKRQRYQYRLMNDGKPSSMTQERIDALACLNFVWDSHGSAWDVHYEQLIGYHANHGHCNVSARYPLNQSLASWVKHQRRQYRRFHAGEPANITTERIAKLEQIGFQWRLRASPTATTTSRAQSK